LPNQSIQTTIFVEGQQFGKSANEVIVDKYLWYGPTPSQSLHFLAAVVVAGDLDVVEAKTFLRKKHPGSRTICAGVIAVNYNFWLGAHSFPAC
jgi:hypothetical protein